MDKAALCAPESIVGRYALFGPIAVGGMATVHYGRLLGTAGFARTVAIKRLHRQYVSDPDFVSMLLDEARLCSRIQHPNVVSILDVVPCDGELFLVMEYVHGETLSRLLRATRAAGELMPFRIVASIVSHLLHGLHAAHEATSENGEPLNIVHRDVSPQNVLVGIDGVARVLDFGIAKAAWRIQTTKTGEVKGKISYMAPEQIWGGQIDRRTDIYAASVVLWETLTAQRLLDADNQANFLGRLVTAEFAPPSSVVPTIPPELDAIVMQGLQRDPEKRFSTAREMAIALEDAMGLATQRTVGEWVAKRAADSLLKQRANIAEIESASMIRRTVPDTEQVTLSPSELQSDSIQLAHVGTTGAHSGSRLIHARDAGLQEQTAALSPSVALSSQPGFQPLVPSSTVAQQQPAQTVPLRTALLVGLGLLAVLGIGIALWSALSKPVLSASIPSAEVPSTLAASPSANASGANTTAKASPLENAQEASAAVNNPINAAPPSPATSSPAVANNDDVHGGAQPIANAAHKQQRQHDKATGPASPPGGKSAPNCTPPFVMDAEGIRRMKPECLL